MLKKPWVLNVGFWVFFGYYFSGSGSKNVGFFLRVSGFQVPEPITRSGWNVQECGSFLYIIRQLKSGAETTGPEESKEIFGEMFTLVDFEVSCERLSGNCLLPSSLHFTDRVLVFFSNSFNWRFFFNWTTHVLCTFSCTRLLLAESYYTTSMFSMHVVQ